MLKTIILARTVAHLQIPSIFEITLNERIINEEFIIITIVTTSHHHRHNQPQRSSNHRSQAD